MLGPTHRMAGALAGVGFASVSGQPLSMVVMSGLVASSTSHGWASPDVDQAGPWVTVRRRLPDAVARTMNHRELSHWWAVPVLGWLAVQPMAPDARWIASLLIVGWASHLVGDVLFGDLPLWPGGRRVGLGLDTGGFWETGRAKLRGGRTVRVLPVGPMRVVIAAGLAWLLIHA